ncbi:hypothetical protein Godav_021633, partial [Gossypium davidsonii]|nr:hypothetical protein [Gossypium davidsonii]
EKLKLTLAAIRAVVLDAEQQQAQNHEISHLLHKFKDACYEMEDLKDEFEIQALKRQVLEQGNILACRFRMGNKIKKANEMLNEIAACNGNIKRLPNSICNLQSLQTLDLYECRGIEELPKDIRFKNLTTLQTLAISDCEKLDLTNGELDLESKEDGSLQKLANGGVPKLESLPQWILLGSTKTLQHLFISDLENVLTLPASNARPRCTKILRIEGCPRLNKKCIEETGEDWSKVAHVPDFYCEAMKTSTTDDE